MKEPDIVREMTISLPSNKDHLVPVLDCTVGVNVPWPLLGSHHLPGLPVWTEKDQSWQDKRQDKLPRSNFTKSEDGWRLFSPPYIHRFESCSTAVWLCRGVGAKWFTKDGSDLKIRCQLLEGKWNIQTSALDPLRSWYPPNMNMESLYTVAEWPRNDLGAFAPLKVLPLCHVLALGSKNQLDHVLLEKSHLNIKNPQWHLLIIAETDFPTKNIQFVFIFHHGVILQVSWSLTTHFNLFPTLVIWRWKTEMQWILIFVVSGVKGIFKSYFNFQDGARK